MSRANEVRELPVKLTDSEFKVRASELASAAQRIVFKKEEIKEATKAMKVELAELEEIHSKLVRIVDQKREDRDVECSWTPDYVRKMWVLHRDDTGEEVATEPMSQKDLQTRIQLEYVNPETGEVKPNDN